MREEAEKEAQEKAEYEEHLKSQKAGHKKNKSSLDLPKPEMIDIDELLKDASDYQA